MLGFGLQNLYIVKIKSRTTRRQPYHHGALRAALIDAAGQLLTERGPAGVGLREAARRAGVSQAAPYHYFGSKAALLNAVGEAAFARFEEMQTAALERASREPGARLSALVTCYIRFALERPHLFAAMTPRITERFVGAVRSARLAAGHDDLDADAMAMLLMAVPHGLAALYISGRLATAGATPILVEQLARAALDALLSIPTQDGGGEWAV
jgi:AcrR family transcriptional regulator